ncbi:MAG: diacylglycerol kinase family lipid kinase [Rhizobiaceae bacterium]|nr:diacylglycerol kinase family lipid kinase [Rhizobiaceae bacterium]MCV0408363.1 diacylglycerol kinase family lipid kinase [Rhizobiaceae bacterium]
MKFLAVLNRDGGTLRSMDLDALSDQIRQGLEPAGHTVVVDIVDGRDICHAIEAATKTRGIDVLMAGGGDGTISAAAAALAGSRKALAVLPAGTMNLFAHSLGVPLDLSGAVASFADGQIRKVDVARANGRVFIHQFSVGLHAKLVAQRQRMEFQSRFGKIRASAKAAIDTILHPPNLRVELEIDGERRLVRTPGIGVSNNVFGEGHLPYADDPAGGVLGVYITHARQRSEMILFSMNMALGRWETNNQVELFQAQTVTLRMKPARRRHKCVVDGELSDMDPETHIEIAKGALRVLVPRSPQDG